MGWPFSCLLDFVADCRESGDYCFSTRMDQFCWEVVNSTWRPFLQRLYCSLIFFAKDGMVWGQFSTDGSLLVFWLCSSKQYSVQRFSISRSSIWHLPERSWTAVAFPCFTVVNFFTSRHALSLSFFQGFSSVSLHCSPLRPRVSSSGRVC